MKLFSESTASLKEKEKSNDINPNYKGEDLPFLIAETITTSMEVDSFVHRINSEADKYVAEAADSRGVDLEVDSPERDELFMEAAFGEGQEDGILKKAWEFIKKMFQKVVDFFKGILGRFQNVEKLITDTVNLWRNLKEEADNKTLPDGAELTHQRVEWKAALDVSVALLDVKATYLNAPVGGQKYADINGIVKTLNEKVRSGGAFTGEVNKLSSAVQDMNQVLGGGNDAKAQHKLMVEIYSQDSVVGQLDEAKKLDANDTDQDLKKVLLDATFLGDDETKSGSELKAHVQELANYILSEAIQVTELKKMVSDGKDEFEEKANEFDKAASQLDKLADREQGDGGGSADISKLVAALNNYSSIVGAYTTVLTKAYTFALEYTRQSFNEYKSYGKSAMKVFDKEGSSN